MTVVDEELYAKIPEVPTRKMPTPSGMSGAATTGKVNARIRSMLRAPTPGHQPFPRQHPRHILRQPRASVAGLRFSHINDNLHPYTTTYYTQPLQDYAHSSNIQFPSKTNSMPRLRILAGPTPDELVPILANSGRPTRITSDAFDGEVAVYIKGFADMEGRVGDSEYFEKRSGVTWSIQVQGASTIAVSGERG